jgi:hypothetical protein
MPSSSAAGDCSSLIIPDVGAINQSAGVPLVDADSRLPRGGVCPAERQAARAYQRRGQCSPKELFEVFMEHVSETAPVPRRTLLARLAYHSI